jgi:hypothetical protein
MSKKKDLQIDFLKTEFRKYLELNHSDFKTTTTSTKVNAAFYIHKNEIGDSLFDALKNEQKMKQYREKIENYLTTDRKVKSPKRNSYNYLSALKLLNEYIDKTYDGIEEFLSIKPVRLNNDNLLLLNSNRSIKEEIKKIPIPTPSEKELQQYLNKWDSLDNYVAQEKALNKLFINVYPNNTNIDEVLIKVSSLNDFYSTHLYSSYKMAKHITELDIDKRLQDEDFSLVEDIAKVINKNDKQIKYYSFASKYCSHHKPLVYPIYDSFVDEVLWHYIKENKDSIFKKEDLKNYDKFKDILLNFKSSYNLNNYSLKEIDKYLWQFGKDFFNKNKKCPNCSSSNTVEIVYGYPPRKLLQKNQESKVQLDGCCIDYKNPNYHCQNCGHEF